VPNASHCSEANRASQLFLVIRLNVS